MRRDGVDAPVVVVFGFVHMSQMVELRVQPLFNYLRKGQRLGYRFLFV